MASSRPRLFPEAEAQRPGSGQRPPSPALFRAVLQTALLFAVGVCQGGEGGRPRRGCRQPLGSPGEDSE